jgi:hypothetical protein
MQRYVDLRADDYDKVINGVESDIGDYIFEIRKG